MQSSDEGWFNELETTALSKSIITNEAINI